VLIAAKSWMAGTRPAMTQKASRPAMLVLLRQFLSNPLKLRAFLTYYAFP
jgi:hypothetical protein